MKNKKMNYHWFRLRHCSEYATKRIWNHWWPCKMELPVMFRYGNGRRNYEENLQRLFHRLSHLLPPSTLLLWLSAMPLGAKVRGGVILEHLRFFEATIRYDVAEANYLAHQVGCFTAKWLPFYSEHFQVRFLGIKLSYFDLNFTEICSS